jgi:hypothetical protein
MIKKNYLSRAQTRTMAFEHPIGDPTGGPAYGEKNDPITAVLSIATMAGTYAAAGTFAAMTLMQGITFAGAALSLVGNISGNKTLSKIGMIAGIAGGIGSFAESQGLFNSGTVGETFGMNSSVTDEVLKAAPSSVTPVIDGVQNTAVPSSSPVEINAVPNAIDGSYQTTNLNTPSGAASPLNAPSGGENLLNAAPNITPGINPGLTPGKDILGRNLPQMSYAPGMGPNVSVGTAPTPSFMDSVKAGNYGQALSTAGGNAMDLLKNNPTGAYVAAQAVGAAADFLSGKTDAELDALKANTGYADAKALEVQAALDREKLRRANLNAGYTNVNAGFKVNPNAVVSQPYQQQPGLVAGAMQPRQG